MDGGQTCVSRLTGSDWLARTDTTVCHLADCDHGSQMTMLNGTVGVRNNDRLEDAAVRSRPPCQLRVSPPFTRIVGFQKRRILLSRCSASIL
jgi:hypothetical protein